MGIAVEVEAGDAAGLEVDFAVVIAVVIDAGNDNEFVSEDLGIGSLMKVVLPKFVRGFQDAELRHT